MNNRILIVDDERNTREGIAKYLKMKGFVCTLADNGQSALEALEHHSADLVLTDLRMPKLGGMDLIKRIKSDYPSVKIVVLTAYGSVESAVEAVKRGADDFLTKPINLDKLYITVQKILDNKRLAEENIILRRQLNDKFGLENIIGNSAKMNRVYDIIKQVAPSRATVLIQGESGTGKELVARAIHQLSPRSAYPFVPVHCAALSDTLLESELFGHEKGAFTGAIEQRVGRFEKADKGTLFLDEVSEISPEVQVKLLRVLQEQVFERVGGAKTLKVDIRVVAATNKELESQMRQHKFREDLFYRLSVVTITVPPLRQRVDDIPLLVKHYLDFFAKENNRHNMWIEPDVLTALQHYPWPGNVRELRNCMENMVVLAKKDCITIDDLPDKIKNSISVYPSTYLTGTEQPATFHADKNTLDIHRHEKNLILRALREHNGNRTQAAKALGFSRRTLYRKLEKYNIE